jgi:regulator of replication initiation timing
MKTEVCRDFNRGECPRGRNCPYLHRYIPTLKPGQSAEVCRDYNRGECSRGNDCPYVHEKVNVDFNSRQSPMHSNNKQPKPRNSEDSLIRDLEKVLIADSQSLREMNKSLLEENRTLRDENHKLHEQILKLQQQLMAKQNGGYSNHSDKYLQPL